MVSATIRDLLAAGAHFGHRKQYRNPQMTPYIFGERNGVSIINLEKTVIGLDRALAFLGEVAERGGKILFVATKLTARESVIAQAGACHMPYVDYRWLGGMLTNYKTIRNSIRHLKDLDEKIASGALDPLSKKEARMITREQEKLNRILRGVCDMGRLPDALFIVGVDCHKTAVLEANKLRIPIVGIVDTNSSTAGVDYVIPGNDDSSRAVELYLTLASRAIQEGQQRSMAQATVAEGNFVEVDDLDLPPKAPVLAAAKKVRAPAGGSTSESGAAPVATPAEPSPSEAVQAPAPQKCTPPAQPKVGPKAPSDTPAKAAAQSLPKGE